MVRFVRFTDDDDDDDDDADADADADDAFCSVSRLTLEESEVIRGPENGEKNSPGN